MLNDNIGGKYNPPKEQFVTLKNESYRRNKNEADHDDNKIHRRNGGFTPVAQKLKPAGKCSAGYAWYYINGSDVAQHILTPADDEQTRAHKLSCSVA